MIFRFTQSIHKSFKLEGCFAFRFIVKQELQVSPEFSVIPANLSKDTIAKFKLLVHGNTGGQMLQQV